MQQTAASMAETLATPAPLDSGAANAATLTLAAGGTGTMPPAEGTFGQLAPSVACREFGDYELLDEIARCPWSGEDSSSAS